MSDTPTSPAGAGPPSAQAEPALVPELEVRSLEASLAFYVDRLGFAVRYSRPDEGFAYLTLGGVHLMLEELRDGNRSFTTAPLEPPFGRGVNLQLAVPDVDALLGRLAPAPDELVVPLEERWYCVDDVELGNRQFVVADPDGYRLRPFTDLGSRLPRR